MVLSSPSLSPPLAHEVWEIHSSLWNTKYFLLFTNFFLFSSTLGCVYFCLLCLYMFVLGVCLLNKCFLFGHVFSWYRMNITSNAYLLVIFSLKILHIHIVHSTRSSRYWLNFALALSIPLSLFLTHVLAPIYRIYPSNTHNRINFVWNDTSVFCCYTFFFSAFSII